MAKYDPYLVGSAISLTVFEAEKRTRGKGLELQSIFTF